jgi:hypothetical protein
MARIIRLLSLLLVALPSTLLSAQDLTGVWRGTFYNEYEYLFTGAKYRYEVQMKNVGKGVRGVTYSYQTTRFYGKANFIGIWSSGSGDLTLKEDQMTDLKITGGGDGCLMTCYLSYRKEGTHEYLEGTYSSVNMRNDTIPCGGGIVRLERVPDSDFELEDFLKNPETTAKGGSKPSVKPGQAEFLVKKPTTPSSNNSKPSTSTPKPSSGSKPPATPPTTAKKTTKPPAPKPQAKDSNVVAKTTVPATKTEEPIVTKAPPVKTAAPKALTSRKNEIVETISTGAKFLEISFYDNGEIDGDTISVYDNNKLLVSRKGLSTEPITIKVELDENDSEHEVVMVAENLGSIPPNTALMIVQAGAQRFTVRLSSTEQKNAAVRFRYDADALK